MSKEVFIIKERKVIAVNLHNTIKVINREPFHLLSYIGECIVWTWRGDYYLSAAEAISSLYEVQLEWVK